MKEKGMSRGEFNSVKQALGGTEKLLNENSKDKEILVMLNYLSDADKEEKILENPQIIKTSSEVGDYDEGCLSIPQVYETISRPVAVTVQALNEKGRPFTLDADGLLARIIQHEYDHLDGILYIDRGDKAFAEKTELQFKRRAERAKEKEKAKAAKAAKIAAKIAAKEAKKTK